MIKNLRSCHCYQQTKGYSFNQTMELICLSLCDENTFSLCSLYIALGLCPLHLNIVARWICRLCYISNILFCIITLQSIRYTKKNKKV